ncbi:MAG TPA: agmatinase [Bacteroidales bacterium]|nr:agmatinase [Bacteroidales bacterium]
MNFGGYECQSGYDDSEIIIVPVPFDTTSSWIKGSDKGVSAIMEASPNLEFYDIETGSDIRSKGIFTLPEIIVPSADLLVDQVRSTVSGLFDAHKFPVVIGGNHTATIGSARAAAEKFENLTVLQLDAHTDLRDAYENSGYNHACVMARVREMANIVQVGIRSMAEEELKYCDPERVYFAHQLYYDKGLYDKAIDQLTDVIYITIDLDVLDPGIMPSTGTPEPGGLQYYELTHFLKKVIAKRNVVAFDVVELCPISDNKAPDFLAAKLIYQILSYRFGTRRHS